VRSRPHVLHVWKRLGPLTASGRAFFNTIVSVPRVSPSAIQLWFSGIALSAVDAQAHLRRAESSFSFSLRVGCSWSRFHGPPSSFPVPTGRSLVVHLCTSLRGASRCIQRRPSPLRCAPRDVGPRLLSDRCLLTVASSVLVEPTSFIKIVQPLQIATDVSVPLPLALVSSVPPRPTPIARSVVWDQGVNNVAPTVRQAWHESHWVLR
jgi:hypothetical protein